MDDGQHAVSRRVRTFCLILLALAVAGVVLMGLRLRASYLAHHITLPDGSTIELLGTSVGTAPFKTESKWKAVQRYLPAHFQKWLPASTSSMTCGTSNGVTVHLRLPSMATPGTAPWSAVETEDDSGFRYSPNGGTCSSLDNGGKPVYGITLNCFPRRQREFPLRFLDPNGALLGTLRVMNPLSGSFPEWKPAPLPQTCTNGPVTLTLNGFEQHVQGKWTNSQAKWQVNSSDPAWMHGKAKRETFLDASGNEGYRLSPREAAWKLRTFVYRERLQDFAAEEQLVVTNVALPTAGSYTPIDQAATLAGVRIKVLVLASPGRFGLSNGVTRFMLPITQGTSGTSYASDGRNTVETWGASSPFLLIETLDMQPGDELQLYVQDDQGREFNTQASGSKSGWGAGNTFNPALTLASDAKSISIRAAISRPLTFEFLVKPKVVTAKK